LVWFAQRRVPPAKTPHTIASPSPFREKAVPCKPKAGTGSTVYLHFMRKESLPSLWQLGDYVSLTFPDNGILKQAKVIKVAFTEHSEPLYDVEVPFKFYQGDYDPESPDMPTTGHVRLHGLKEWHLRNPEHPIADRMPLAK